MKSGRFVDLIIKKKSIRTRVVGLVHVAARAKALHNLRIIGDGKSQFHAPI
jgi:hypothetical protein